VGLRQENSWGNTSFDSFENHSSTCPRLKLAEPSPSNFKVVIIQQQHTTATMVASIRAVALLTGLASIHGAVAADSPFKIETRDDILASSRTLAHDLVALYKGNETGGIPGVLTPEFSAKGGGYFWDEAAHFWGTLIDYWRLTGDETYNDLVIKGIQFQRGPNDNFMPPNQTAALGNPDQCVWALSALRAAENNFPSPPSGGVPYLTLAQNVFDNQFSRFRSEVEAGTCGGGLRWQIPMINNGYNYKESMFPCPSV